MQLQCDNNNWIVKKWHNVALRINRAKMRANMRAGIGIYIYTYVCIYICVCK